MDRLCRCFCVPDDTQFVKDKIYKWDYIIDGYVAYHESDGESSAGEIDFYRHFQILTGKDK